MTSLSEITGDESDTLPAMSNASSEIRQQQGTASPAKWVAASTGVFALACYVFVVTYSFMGFCGVLICYPVALMAVRTKLLQNRNPTIEMDDLMADRFGSAFYVLAGYVLGVLVLIGMVVIFFLTL